MRFPASAAALALAAALAGVLAPAAPVTAQVPITDRIDLDPGLVEILGRPGATFGDRFTLINRTSEQISVEVLVEDLGADAEGTIVAVPRGTGQSSAAAWIEVSEEIVDIGPNSTRQIDAEITIPPGTRAGGYYASVTFDSDSARSPDQRLTHAVLVRIDGAGVAARPRLVSVSLPTISFSGSVEIEAIVENAGNVHAIGAGAVDVDATFSGRVGSVPIPAVVLLPMNQRVLRLRFDSPPVVGRLKATATLQFGDVRAQAGATGYVMIWWLAAALAAVLALFAVALVRGLGLAGPKAAERKAARAPAPAPVPAAPQTAMRIEPAPLVKPPEAEPEKRRIGRRKPKEEPAAEPPEPRPAAAGPAPVAVTPGSSAPAPVGPRPDESFWGPSEGEDEIELPARREFEPVEEAEPAGEEEPIAEPEDEGMVRSRRPSSLPRKSVPVVPSASEPVAEEESDEAGEEPETLWSEGEEEPEKTAPPPRSGPVPVVPAARPATPPSEDFDDFEEEPGETGEPLIRRSPVVSEPIEPPEPEEIRPAPRVPRPIQVAGLPPLPEPATLPETRWSQPPPDQPLERPAGGGAGMALRRAEVALRMIAGKPGETGAILDAGLDLLYSVRSDPEVVARVERAYFETRNRRRLGPLALALFAVDSRNAPEALLDSYGTASKVVAERVRRAILACDPADLRPHRALLDALPQARRDALGL